MLTAAATHLHDHVPCIICILGHALHQAVPARTLAKAGIDLVHAALVQRGAGALTRNTSPTTSASDVVSAGGDVSPAWLY